MKQIFESDHIRYVTVSEELIDDYLLMVNDWENVNKYLGRHDKTYTAEQEVKWVRMKLEAKDPVFSMIGKDTGDFIGNIELMDVTDSSGELGIAITAGKQNRGLGTEAVSAMTEYGKNVLGLTRIYLKADPENARAIRVYEKCGFRIYDRTDEDVYMEYSGKETEKNTAP